MNLELREEPLSALAEHAHVSIACSVDRILEVSVVDGGLGGIRLTERPVAVPYLKDYDAIKGDGPTRWASRFDLSNWGLISAHVNGERVGGAVIAFNTANVNMLEGRKDLAVLWDLRVHPEMRGRGIGSRLFAAVEDWVRSRECTTLKIETQNNNVAACRFYARMGCTLGAIDRFAYPELPDETQLLWFKDVALSQ